jgi:hypothetical protein
MLLYIDLKFQVNQSSRRDYFKWLKLIDESCQICFYEPLYIVWTIYRAT